MSNVTSGSLGPFELTKISVVNMAVKMQEATVIQKLLDSPSPENLEVLSRFILTDPQFLSKSLEDLPN